MSSRSGSPLKSTADKILSGDAAMCSSCHYLGSLMSLAQTTCNAVPAIGARAACCATKPATIAPADRRNLPAGSPFTASLQTALSAGSPNCADTGAFPGAARRAPNATIVTIWRVPALNSREVSARGSVSKGKRQRGAADRSAQAARPPRRPSRFWSTSCGAATRPPFTRCTGRFSRRCCGI